MTRGITLQSEGRNPGELRLARSLNEYHQEFLKQLLQENVEYLIIGGQARRYHLGDTTIDLDLWIHRDTPNLLRFISVFSSWRERYSNHTGILGPVHPDHIEAKTQVQLPDADVAILQSDDSILELTEQNRIDILFEIGLDDFCICMDRASQSQFGSILALSDCLQEKESW